MTDYTKFNITEIKLAADLRIANKQIEAQRLVIDSMRHQLKTAVSVLCGALDTATHQDKQIEELSANINALRQRSTQDTEMLRQLTDNHNANVRVYEEYKQLVRKARDQLRADRLAICTDCEPCNGEKILTAILGEGGGNEGKPEKKTDPAYFGSPS